jgi:hypothetical protein
MEDFEEVDLTEYKNQRNQLIRLSLDRYEKVFKRNWKVYLADVFKFDDEPMEYVKPLPLVAKKKTHPFEKWV